MHLMHLQRPSGENMLPSRRVNSSSLAPRNSVVLFSQKLITRCGPCGPFPGSERPQAPWPLRREVSLGEGGQAHSRVGGGPPGLWRDSLPACAF